MNQWTNYIGIFAGICTAVSMLPQLVKIIREKEADDISYVMLIILMTGLSAWIWYGFLKDDFPIMVTNAFSLLVNLLVIFFTIKYKNKDKHHLPVSESGSSTGLD